MRDAYVIFSFAVASIVANLVSSPYQKRRAPEELANARNQVAYNERFDLAKKRRKEGSAPGSETEGVPPKVAEVGARVKRVEKQSTHGDGE